MSFFDVLVAFAVVVAKLAPMPNRIDLKEKFEQIFVFAIS